MLQGGNLGYNIMYSVQLGIHTIHRQYRVQNPSHIIGRGLRGMPNGVHTVDLMLRHPYC